MGTGNLLNLEFIPGQLPFQDRLVAFGAYPTPYFYNTFRKQLRPVSLYKTKTWPRTVDLSNQEISRLKIACT
jgi:hypothetical protein